MKTVKSIIGGLCLFSFQLKSQNPGVFYLEPGLSLGTQQSSFTGGVCGAFGVYLKPQHSINFGARELFNSSSSTVVSAIHFTYRYHFKNGFYAGGGFAHQHEISAPDYVAEPLSASIGTSKHIFHRSGVMLEGGYIFPGLGKKGILRHLVPATGISASFMADGGSNPLLMLNGGLRYAF